MRSRDSTKVVIFSAMVNRGLWRREWSDCSKSTPDRLHIMRSQDSPTVVIFCSGEVRYFANQNGLPAGHSKSSGLVDGNTTIQLADITFYGLVFNASVNLLGST